MQHPPVPRSLAPIPSLPPFRPTRRLLTASLLVAATWITACASGVSATPAAPEAARNAADDGAAARTGAGAAAGGADIQPHATMLRYPAVNGTHIVFSYANDLWMVPRAGGVATPLASPPGQEMYPRFSPDGTMLAFIGNYEGNRDVYTIPVAGGIATRVTHHPAGEDLCGWTPDGRVLFTSTATAPMTRFTQLLAVSPSGGMPEKLPVPYSGFASVSPDGVWLAYTPYSIDNRTWKRYRGGMATDVWLFNLKDHSSKRITEWEGTDTLPMWNLTDVYYLSDEGPQHRLNIWRYDTTTGKREQVTEFADNDVKWPSMGPGADGQGEIVFQLGSRLRLLDLGTRKVSSVEVIIPGDRPTIRSRAVNAAEYITAYAASPTGKRIAVEGRGDIWTLPAREGAPRNLTRSDSSAERDPSWSPDGKWIAYFSDKGGEYDLWITPADGKSEARKLTDLGPGYRYAPVWSPDSRHIAFTDKAGALLLCSLSGEGEALTGSAKQIDIDPWTEQMSVSWSPDSAWLAYARSDEGNNQKCIWLYSVASGEKHQVTDRMFDSDAPAFDRKGDFLYFRSTRNFQSPIYGETDNSFVYAGTQVLLAAPLRADVKSPWAPKNDEEGDKDKKDEGKDKDKGKEKKDDGDKPNDGDKPKDAAAGAHAPQPPADGDDAKDEPKKDGEKKDDDAAKGKKDEKPKPVKIDLDGFEARAFPVPVKPGNFGQIAVSHDGKLIFVRRLARGLPGEPSIKILDPSDEKKEEKTVIDGGVGGFDMTADGKKLVVRKQKTMAVIDAAPNQNLEKPVPTAGMRMTIDPRAEWRQIFTDAWRFQRDFFYDPNMHGLDWAAVRDHYRAMLEDCATRQDVTYVIAEMISELNVGHAYITAPGDVGEEPSVPGGLLGCDFELVTPPAGAENAVPAYRISKIYGGAPWDTDSRGPLAQPGLGVKVGDYLLAVNGMPVDASRDPWAALVGTADRTTTITVSDKPVIDSSARDIVVKPAASEAGVRYRDWVEKNRQYVLERTSGRVGYIHVPDTGVNGQNELVRQFYGQRDKDALIIDDRWNGGGQIPTRFIELLNRPATNYWARRDGNDWPWPPDAHFGPKCMLINGRAGSGGDAFPAYFRRAGLGKLLGTRTWGGLVGISGNPGLVDGGAISVPTFGYYELDSTWGIEGHGVDPDIEVLDDPAKMVGGGDPQLDAATDLMLQEIKDRPYKKPSRPKYPDRRGMGIPESDR